MLYFGKSIVDISTPCRAGLIPFTIRIDECTGNPTLYYLVAIDRKTREYADFGGGCKRGETFVDGALREFNEESCEIFNNVITKEDLLKSVVITDITRSNAIFFVQIKEWWLYNAERKFKENQEHDFFNRKKYNENIGIKWLSEDNFNKVSFNKTSTNMWRKLQHFLIKNCSMKELKIYLNLAEYIFNAFSFASDLADKPIRDLLVCN